jgi:peptidoglycan/LPS O-acetylase OafA/YrhL
VRVRSAPGVATSAHLPGLDGLRGFAILAVIVHHVFQRVPRGEGLDAAVYGIGNTGWFGVDLFFALSGFLITGILIDQRGRSGYFRTFYARRVLRIVPVYVVLLLFSMWVAPVVGAATPAIAHELRATQGWYWTYTPNIYYALHGFAAEGSPSHLWSLAVEEQFYLLWPCVVAFATPRALPRVALGSIVAAQLCRILFVALGASGRVLYVLLPTRMDGLAVGAFLACAVRDPALMRAVTRWRAAAMAVVLALLGVEAGLNRALGQVLPITQLFGFPAIALVSGLILLLVMQSSTLLTGRALRFAGRYSYGMYLWHLLVLHALMTRMPALAPRLVGGSYLAYDVLILVAVLAVTVLVALVSWHLIEQPFLRLKRFVPYAPVRTRPVAVSIAAVSP